MSTPPHKNHPYPEFLDDAEVSSLRARVRELAEIALDGRLGLLLGAGFSYTAEGLPLGGTLASMLVRKALGSGCSTDTASRIASKYGLAAAAQRFHDDATGQRTALVKFLQNELANEADEPNYSLTQLSNVVSAAGVTRVFTTNYDTLIEKALGPRGVTVADSAAGVREFEQAAAKEFKVGVFHIYGDVSNPLITDEELRDVQSVHLNEFRHELLRNVFAFVGYSFRDDDLIAIYRQISEVLRRSKETWQPFIVMPIEDNYEYSFARELWHRRHNIRLIPLDGGVFFAQLHDGILNHRLAAAISRIAKTAGVSEEEATRRFEELKDRASILEPHEIERIARHLRRPSDKAK